MGAKIAPNPHSPYATADPNLRHLIPSLFGLPLAPGGLVLTGCERMAVAPEETLSDATDAIRTGDLSNLPENLCAPCVIIATGRGSVDRLAPEKCRECGETSSQGEWCALCRQDMHETWWQTRPANLPGEAL